MSADFVLADGSPNRGRHVETNSTEIIRGVIRPPLIHDAYFNVRSVEVFDSENIEWDLARLFDLYPDAVDIRFGGLARNLGVLAEFPIVSISFWGKPHPAEVIPLAAMSKLEAFHRSGGESAKEPRLHLDKFANANLRGLSLFRTKLVDADLQILCGFPNLRRLSLCFEEVSSLSGLKHAPLLSELELAYIKTPTLDGIEGALVLKKLQLGSLSRLVDIKALANMRQIQSIKIESCNRIADFNPLSRVDGLTEFTLAGRCAIPSLDFIEGANALRYLALLGVNILDGKLSWLAGRPALTGVIWPQRRHYDMKWGEEI